MNVRTNLPAVLALGTEGQPETNLRGAGAYDAASQRWMSAGAKVPWQLTCTTSGGDHEGHETAA
jgi:hypothetical protein